MSCCSFFDQRLVLEKRLDIVLQRETTDEPFGLEVGRVEGKLFIQEVKTESWLYEEGSEEGKYIEHIIFISNLCFYKQKNS